MADYTFDVFFSYKRDEQTNEWHKKVKDKIVFWVEKELKPPRKVNVFFDTECINEGEKWQKKIANSLKKSKCLVAIWSPDYFYSKWCLSEWRSFVARERKYSLEGKLITPARFHDGDSFPPEAQLTQSADFTEYNSTMAFFWNTEDAYMFEKEKLKSFAKTIAKKIMDSPEYKDDFPIEIIDPKELDISSEIRRITS